MELVVAPFELTLRFFYFKLVCFKAAVAPPTLVSQKVLLLN